MEKSLRAPRVAIITRTKNRPIFLKRAIESVKGQTYRDYVHVILNDGGDKDEVERIVTNNVGGEYILVHNKKSVGLVKALNQAISASQSDLIVIHDDDDAWHPQRLEFAITDMDKTDAVASVVPMEIVIETIDKDGDILEVKRLPHPESWTGEISLYKQAHRNYLSNGAVMYARTIYEELGGYNETLPTAEDWDFGIRLMLKYNIEQVVSNEALVYYHQRPDVNDSNIGNSVHARVREQERAIMMLRNNYLRNDLKKGCLGIGYIMNSSEQELINIVRLEAHINRSTGNIVQTVKLAEQNIIEQEQITLYEKLKKKLLNK